MKTTQVIFSQFVLLALFPVDVFVGISRVDFLASVLGLAETCLRSTLNNNGAAWFFRQILHCTLNPSSANRTFFSIKESPFISILVLYSEHKMLEHLVPLQYAIFFSPPFGWRMYHHLSFTVSDETRFSPDAWLRFISCPVLKDKQVTVKWFTEVIKGRLSPCRNKRQLKLNASFFHSCRT